MKPKLIAEVRYGSTAHIRATKIKSAWWFRVWLGRRRMVTCDCGGAVMDRPDAITYEDSWGGCSHIVALYKGNVTSDERVTTGDYTISRVHQYFNDRNPIHFARLTQAGEKMFFWRWTVHRLGGG